MTASKPWYLSKTIWASLVAVAAGVAQAFGHDLDAADQSHIADTILQTLTVGASLFAIFGRLSAESTID